MANDLLEEGFQHWGILGPTPSAANCRDVMLHRKLVSEEVTVLDLWINHGGDSEGGVEGSVTHAALLHSRHADFWRIHQRVNGGGADVSAGSPERCAAGLAGLLGWRVIKRAAMTRRGGGGGARDRDGEKILFSNFGLITAALWNPTFQTIRWKLPVSGWLPLQKTGESAERDTMTIKRADVATSHRSSRWAVQILLVPLFLGASLCKYSCPVSSRPSEWKLVWSFHFTAKSKSHMIICYELVGESAGWVSRLWRTVLIFRWQISTCCDIMSYI